MSSTDSGGRYRLVLPWMQLSVTERGVEEPIPSTFEKQITVEWTYQWTSLTPIIPSNGDVTLAVTVANSDNLLVLVQPNQPGNKQTRIKRVTTMPLELI